MKRIAILLITCTVFSVSAQEGGGIESITPAGTRVFVKSGQVKDFVKFARVLIDTLLPDQKRQKVQASLTEFRKKTGVDLLNAKSLSSAGVDIDRQMAIAWFGDTQEGGDRVVLYIPSSGSRDLPMAFVELMKKLSPVKDADIYPAITDYRGSRVLQVRKDLFMTVVSGYFIMASEGDLLHSVVDLSLSGTGSLAADAMYGDFRKRGAASFDAIAYAGGDYIREMLKQQRRKEKQEKAESGRLHPAGKGSIIMAAVEGQGQVPQADEAEPGRWIDYGALGLSMTGERITSSVSIKCNNSDRAVDALVQALRPGPPAEAIASKAPSVYAVFSLWPERVEEAFGGRDQLGNGYLGIKRKLQAEWGVDMKRDVLPFSTGMVNLILEKGQGLQSKTVVFIPMKTQKSGSIIWDKIRNYQKSRLQGDRFGELSLGGTRAIWSLDDKGKTFIAADTRGLYTGNDGDLLAKAIASKTLGRGGHSPLGDVSRQELFLYLFIDRDSFVRPLLMMGAAGLSQDGSLMQFIGMMGDMNLTGRRDGHFITFDLDIGINRRGR